MNIIDERPEPFSRYDTSIWTDPYVGAKMLELHFSQDTDAASRKLTTIRKTVDVISRLAGPAGRILDLGCGSGLYAVRRDVRDRRKLRKGIPYERRCSPQ